MTVIFAMMICTVMMMASSSRKHVRELMHWLLLAMIKKISIMMRKTYLVVKCIQSRTLGVNVSNLVTEIDLLS